jgi:(p)ppGpp synthase/HD superfamily hydrolase
MTSVDQLDIPRFGLEYAVTLAAEVHADQLDKGDNGPYIRHPFVVMFAVAPFGETVQTIAVLHDAVEDTDLELDDLVRLGASELVVSGIDAVSKRDGEPYDGLIRRAKAHRGGDIVKLADNFHNSLPERLANFSQAERVRREKKYATGLKILLENNPRLTEIAPALGERVVQAHATIYHPI